MYAWQLQKQRKPYTQNTTDVTAIMTQKYYQSPKKANHTLSNDNFLQNESLFLTLTTGLSIKAYQN